jgi:endonuclease-3
MIKRKKIIDKMNRKEIEKEQMEKDIKKKIEALEKIILKHKDFYGIYEFAQRKRGNILDVVVKTILSQNTSDKLRDIAFDNLKRKYKNMFELLEVESSEIEGLIRICGLPAIKTKRIKNALQKIKERFQNPSDLCKLGKEKAFEFLTSIDGIGPKSAEVILAFGCGFDTFPVDTHISRIMTRLGIATGSREKIYRLVSPHFKNKILSHIFLINHGRNICKALKPRCDICFFKKICDFYKEKI